MLFCSFQIQDYLAGFLISVISYFQEIPADKTGDFDKIYAFLKENWKIAKWVALGAVVFEVSMNCCLLPLVLWRTYISCVQLKWLPADQLSLSLSTFLRYVI